MTASLLLLYDNFSKDPLSYEPPAPAPGYPPRRPPTPTSWIARHHWAAWAYAIIGLLLLVGLIATQGQQQRSNHVTPKPSRTTTALSAGEQRFVNDYRNYWSAMGIPDQGSSHEIASVGDSICTFLDAGFPPSLVATLASLPANAPLSGGHWSAWPAGTSARVFR